MIDYTQADFTQSDERYDLILDNVASRSFSDLRRVLAPQGMIIPNSGHGGMTYVIKGMMLSPFMGQQRSPLMTSPNREDLTALAELIDSGRVTPVIDQSFALENAAAALYHLENDHARGKIVLTVEKDQPDAA